MNNDPKVVVKVSPKNPVVREIHSDFRMSDLAGPVERTVITLLQKEDTRPNSAMGTTANKFYWDLARLGEPHGLKKILLSPYQLTLIKNEAFDWQPLMQLTEELLAKHYLEGVPPKIEARDVRTYWALLIEKYKK